MKNKILFIIFFNIFYAYSQEIDKTEFMPESGKYIVSGWVKEIHPEQVINYNSFIKIELSNNNTPQTFEFYPSGEVIDGWKRIVGIFTIPDFNITSNLKLLISLHCMNSSNNECYFDDIRFYPYNGSMKSFVYAEDTQRLMAELDENNYATFYEYDLEGGLVRIKKETEKGVMTIQETRSNTIKIE